MTDDTKQIKIITVDDHPVLRLGIAPLIADESDTTLVARTMETFYGGVSGDAQDRDQIAQIGERNPQRK